MPSQNPAFDDLSGTDSSNGADLPPKVYRTMRKDADGLPETGTAAAMLGVRPGVDVTTDAAGNVPPGREGMSVAPGWRDLPPFRIPKRLRPLSPGARGSNRTACYTFGDEPFRTGRFAEGLELIPDRMPDPPKHGVVAPSAAVPLDRYQRDLARTRYAWKIDET